jgi:histidine triad (HIT) family protein
VPTLFTKIIKGEIPCHKVLEDDRYFSFLDIRPINPGHVLVIPKNEIDYIFDLDDELLSGILVFSKKVAVAIKKVVPCERIGIMVAGLEVPHTHVHLIPINSIGDLTFARAKAGDQNELAKLAEKIRGALNGK